MVKRKGKILHLPFPGIGMQSILFLLFCVWSSAAHSEILIGEVVGLDNRPKQNASISVFGIKNRRTQTEPNGEFTVNLPPGSYVIRIRQNPNRQEFTYEIREGVPEQKHIFKVNW
jgi:hypothetical protein